MDMVSAIGGEGCAIEEIGIRPGEKIHEEMISTADSINTVELENYFAILPPDNHNLRDFYIKEHQAKPVDIGFSYSSDINKVFLTVDDLTKILDDYNITESNTY